MCPGRLGDPVTGNPGLVPVDIRSRNAKQCRLGIREMCNRDPPKFLELCDCWKVEMWRPLLPTTPQYDVTCQVHLVYVFDWFVLIIRIHRV